MWVTNQTWSFLRFLFSYYNGTNPEASENSQRNNSLGQWRVKGEMKKAIRKYLGGDKTQCPEMKRGREGDHTAGEG